MTNKFKKTFFLTRHVWFETKTGDVRAFEISCKLFHCPLAFCCGIEDLCGQLWDGELLVLSPRCHEDEFSDSCAKVGVVLTFRRCCCRELHPCRTSTWTDRRFRVFQHVKTTRSEMFSSSKPLLFLVISRPKELTVSPSLHNTTTSVKSRLVFTCSKSLMRCSSGPVPTTSSMRRKRIESSDPCVRFFTCVEGSDIYWS